MNSNVLPVGPVALPPTPVWRSYAGGAILRRFRGMDEAGDDHFPEDWLASTVPARNGQNSQGPEEGLSRIGDPAGHQLLASSLRHTPGFWFGPHAVNRGGMRVLWKLLDASVRLQFQAHPDAQFARRHLNSNAGKTECWYIIGTREDACVYLGFQRPPTRESWAAMIREQRVADMLNCFDRIPVRPGDCFVVPAGTPHAIGAGVFMMELMEPTDWVVRCETVNSGVTLPPEACFMGLDLERCLEIFDYRPCPLERVRERFQQRPRVLSGNEGCVEEELIGSDWHAFFRLHRLRGGGNGSWPGGELMLVVVLEGRGHLRGDAEERPLHRGETWLLPGCATRWEWRNGGVPWEILLAKLPTARDTTGGAAGSPAKVSPADNRD